MERFPRLTRPQVLEGLRKHAAKHGFVSLASLRDHDRILHRSILLHFVGLDAARHAAGVPAAPIVIAGAKRGPKKGSKQLARTHRTWSAERVHTELRALHRAGKSTRLDDLLESGKIALVQAAGSFAKGLVAARDAAGIPQPPRRGQAKKPLRWTKAQVETAIRTRHRRKQSLASSKVPQSLFRAARAQFGSWPTALSSLGIDPRDAREYRLTYTKDEIIRRLRGAARAGSDLRSVSLKGVVDAKAIHREFGTLAKAITAAGLDAHLGRRGHGGGKWSPERVIAVLRERAARDEHTLTPGLHRVVQLYFGGAEAARTAAGVPSPTDVRSLARWREKHGIRTPKKRRANVPTAAAFLRSKTKASARARRRSS